MLWPFFAVSPSTARPIVYKQKLFVLLSLSLSPSLCFKEHTETSPLANSVRQWLSLRAFSIPGPGHHLD